MTGSGLVDVLLGDEAVLSSSSSGSLEKQTLTPGMKLRPRQALAHGLG